MKKPAQARPARVFSWGLSPGGDQLRSARATTVRSGAMAVSRPGTAS
jgi:hypothetical protein